MGDIASGISSITSGVSSALTPQNNFSAQAPVNVGALNGQIATSQGNFNQNYQNQNQLAQQLQAQSMGQGPNPAQALLQQGTNNAIQQNAGMLASQKGINPALAARLGSQNAASQSQQAAGQGAVMSAEQQQGAQTGLANLYGTIGNQNLQNVATSGNLVNTGSLGAQGLNAGVSAQNAAANQNTMGGLLNGGGASMLAMIAKGGFVPQKLADGGITNPLSGDVTSGSYDPNSFNFVGTDGTQWGMPQLPPSSGLTPSLNSTPAFPTSAPDQLPGLGQVSSQSVGDISNGSSQGNKPQQQIIPANNASQDIANKILASAGVNIMPAGNTASKNGPGGESSNQSTQKGIAQLLPLAAMALSKGGKVLPFHLAHVASVYHGKPDLQAQGGKVPGQAKVQGDSYANDTVPTMLSPGELVIPRTVMNAKDPVKAGSDFIAQELAKSGKYAGDDNKDFHSALKQAMGARMKNGSN